MKTLSTISQIIGWILFIIGCFTNTIELILIGGLIVLFEKLDDIGDKLDEILNGGYDI